MRIKKLIGHAKDRAIQFINYPLTRGLTHLFTQLAFVNSVYTMLITDFEEFDLNAEQNVNTSLEVSIGFAIVLSSFAAYTSVKIGKHLNEQEEKLLSLNEEGPTEKNTVQLASKNIFPTRVYSMIATAENSFILGVLAYIYTLEPSIKGNPNLDVALRCIAGSITSILAALIKRNERLILFLAKLLLAKKEPDSQLSSFEADEKGYWTRYFRKARMFILFGLPFVSVAQLFTYTADNYLSTPTKQSTQFSQYSLYTTLISLALGLSHTLSFNFSKTYQGLNIIYSLDYLLYSMYIFIGIINPIAGIAWLAGNKELASDINLGGLIALGFIGGPILAPSLTLEHHRMLAIASAEVKQRRAAKLINSGAEQLPPENQLKIEHDRSWKTWSGLKAHCSAFFSHCYRSPKQEAPKEIELSDLENRQVKPIEQDEEALISSSEKPESESLHRKMPCTIM